MFKTGQIVVTEGNRSSWISRVIAWKTRSWWTHAFVVTSKTTGVEAVVPRVRKFNLAERMKQLDQEDRAYAVLEIPYHTLQRGFRIAGTAKTYVGRFYDIGQLYATTGRFWADGSGTVVCSRAVSGILHDSIKHTLFTDECLDTVFADDLDCRDNLLVGVGSAADMFNSTLKVVDFKPSSKISRLPPHLYPPQP